VGRSLSGVVRSRCLVLLLDDDGSRGGSLERLLRLRALDGVDGLALTGELLPVTGELEECLHLIRGLRAHGQPVLRAVRVDLDERGLLGGVVLADLLDRTAVPAGAGV